MQLLKLILALVFAALMHIDSFGQAMPKYAAMVGQRESGKIVRGEFLAQQGVGGMRLIRGNHWESIPIDSFSIIIIRDTIVVMQFKNIGQTFSDFSKAQLKQLMVNDRVLIFNIHGRDYGDKPVFLRPLELVIE